MAAEADAEAAAQAEERRVREEIEACATEPVDDGDDANGDDSNGVDISSDDVNADNTEGDAGEVSGRVLDAVGMNDAAAVAEAV